MATLLYCQLPDRAWPVGAHPARALVGGPGSAPVVPAPRAGGGGGSVSRRGPAPDYTTELERQRIAVEDADVAHLLALLTPLLR